MTKDRLDNREPPGAFRDDDQTLPSPVIRGADGGALGPGRVLDERYTLVERVGAGGWGEVWRAVQNSTRREVALKILRRDLADGEGVQERFQREAEAVSRLVHQNTVTLFDYGRTPDGETYMAMELLDGETLDQVLRREGPMDPLRALRVVRQVGLSLDEAHGKGIVHRDIKPHNIMLLQRPGEPDFVKVLDFGVAKWVLEDHHLTTTGTTFGTPEYMSPEQVQSKPLDHRTDLYSLGVILYTLLVGRPPFRGESPITVALQHINQRIPPLPKGHTVPRDVERLLRRLTAKDPTRRPFSAAEVAEVCDGILRARSLGAAPPTRSAGPWLALVIGVLLGTLVIVLWRPWEGSGDATSFPPPRSAEPTVPPGGSLQSDATSLPPPGSAEPTVPPGGSLQSDAKDVAVEILAAMDIVDALSTAPSGGDDAGASSGENRDVAPAPVPATATATITITSAVRGAVATLPGGATCPCPCRLERDPGTRLKVTVRAPDHEARRISLKFRAGVREVPARLTRVPLSERDGLKGDDPPSSTDGLK